MTVKRALGRVRAPDERAAEERAWAVVHSAYHERPVAVPRRSPWRVALIAALVALIAGVALSPAGATVSRLVRQALGVSHATRGLFSLPAPGRLLVSGPGGTWTVSADGSSRRLGGWSQASWSPHGLYIAVARRDQLAAVDPRGTPRWTLARTAVSSPRWYAPSGFRVAYLSNDELRVVAGDGTGDHLVAPAVANVAPAWRPGHAYQLAYVTSRGRVVVRDGDTRQTQWSAARRSTTRQLAWASDGRRLIAISRGSVQGYGADGHLVRALTVPRGVPVIDGALSPDGRLVALVLGGSSNEVVVESLASHGAAPRRVLAGAGLRNLAWSPDGRWLLVSWPAADQWVFVRVGGTPRIDAVSRIDRQFSADGESGFPRLEGWCCTTAAAR